MQKTIPNKWDINWNKLGKVEPKANTPTTQAVVSVARPSQPKNSPAIARPSPSPSPPAAAKPKPATVTRPQRPMVPARAVKIPAATTPAYDTTTRRAPVRAPTAPPKAINVKENEKKYEVKKMGISTIEKKKSQPHYSDTAQAVVDDTARNQNRRPITTEKLRSDPAKRRGRDLSSGMEMLGLDFLLGVVENHESDETNDVAMRKLGFTELIRTGQVHTADSHALKEYAINAGGLYGKDIQFESMRELAERTAHQPPS